ncbi:MAG: ribosome maturation factor RimP [Lachnospiraceae bacterium]|nr:ribosome maturation factor RimP [Lachnospiraceae bacterium]
MSKYKDYETRTEELVMPILDELKLSLWDVEFVKEGKTFYLRIYIDKEGGVNIEECENVSRRMNELLDEYDYISEEYIFEVSSPGLTRPLVRERDFINSIGRLVEIHTYKAISGSKEFVGKLLEGDPKKVTIDCEGEILTFTKEEMSSIRLSFE